MGVDPPPAPPFPIPVEQFVSELKPPASAATAAQACAAFATLATKAQVPETFRDAVPAVLELVSSDDFLDTKESALAALVAMLACVPGAAEDAVEHKVVDVVLNAAKQADGNRLDMNALEAFRILVTVDAAANAAIENDDAITNLINFVVDRCVGSTSVASNSTRDADGIAEASLDLLCGLAAKRSDGGACRDAVISRNGVTALGRALVAARNDEIAVRAIIGLAMTTGNVKERSELVHVPGACAALTRATRSPDGDVAGGAKVLLKALGQDEHLRPAIAAALRETMTSGAAADMDSA